MTTLRCCLLFVALSCCRQSTPVAEVRTPVHLRLFKYEIPCGDSSWRGTLECALDRDLYNCVTLIPGDDPIDDPYHQRLPEATWCDLSSTAARLTVDAAGELATVEFADATKVVFLFGGEPVFETDQTDPPMPFEALLELSDRLDEEQIAVLTKRIIMKGEESVLVALSSCVKCQGWEALYSSLTPDGKARLKLAYQEKFLKVVEGHETDLDEAVRKSVEHPELSPPEVGTLLAQLVIGSFAAPTKAWALRSLWLLHDPQAPSLACEALGELVVDGASEHAESSREVASAALAVLMSAHAHCEWLSAYLNVPARWCSTRCSPRGPRADDAPAAGEVSAGGRTQPIPVHREDSVGPARQWSNYTFVPSLPPVMCTPEAAADELAAWRRGADDVDPAALALGEARRYGLLTPAMQRRLDRVSYLVFLAPDAGAQSSAEAEVDLVTNGYTNAWDFLCKIPPAVNTLRVGHCLVDLDDGQRRVSVRCPQVP